MNIKQKFILLDRDGVINYDSPNYITSAEQWQPIPGSLEAIAQLTEAGFIIVVCTNQSGIGRQLFSFTTLVAIHDKMQQLVKLNGGKIDAIFFCPHLAEDNCNCRKPKPHMLKLACREFNIAPDTKIAMVGDSLSDLKAVASIGGIPLLVKTGHGLTTLAQGQLPPTTKIFDNLLLAAKYWLKVNSSNEM